MALKTMGSLLRQLDRSKNWLARYKGPHGKWLQRSTGTEDKRVAEQILQQYERNSRIAEVEGLVAHKVVANAIEAERLASGRELRFPTLRVFLNEFLKAKTINKKTATIASYRKTVNLFLEHMRAEADKAVNRVRSSDVQAFIQARMDQGAAPATVRQGIVVLRMMFKRAVDEGICAINPVATVEVPEGESSAKLPFTDEDIALILKACPDEEWRTLVFIGYYTGARMSDCLGFKWEDFDLGEAPKVRYQQKKTGKGSKGWVTIAVHPALKKQLLAWHKTSKAPKEGPILPGLTGRPLGGKTGPSTVFVQLLKTAGVDPCYSVTGRSKQPRKCFHSFRTTLVSKMQSMEVPQEVRMSIVGHASTDVHKGYSQGEWNSVKSAINKLPDLG
jgi:integrase